MSAKKKEQQNEEGSVIVEETAKKVEAMQSPEIAKNIAIAAINKSVGEENGIHVLGDGAISVTDVIPSGLMAVDDAVGIKIVKPDGTGIVGFPRGRIVELFGEEGCGKTTLLNCIIASAQAMGGECAIVDGEHAYDAAFARKNGVDTGKLAFCQNNCAEEALDIMLSLIKTKAYAVVALDSLASLSPKKELEGTIEGDNAMALMGKISSKALRMMVGVVNKSNTLVIITNQFRAGNFSGYGSPNITTGGKALKFYASLRVECKKTAQLKMGEDGDIFGNRHAISVKKNKLAAPFRSAEYDINFENGADRVGNLVEVCLKYGIMIKRGAWHYVGEESVGQGKTAAVETVKSNPALYEKLSKAAFEAMLRK